MNRNRYARPVTKRLFRLAWLAAALALPGAVAALPLGGSGTGSGSPLLAAALLSVFMVAAGLSD